VELHANSTLAEFKEIRKEWKTKKKEEEAQRKADEERARQAEARSASDGQSHRNYENGQVRTATGPQAAMGAGCPQLPPLAYGTAVSGQSQPGYGAPSPAIDGMPQYVKPLSLSLSQNSNDI
jgi:hypothetical protein